MLNKNVLMHLSGQYITHLILNFKTKHFFFILEEKNKLLSEQDQNNANNAFIELDENKDQL